MPPRRLSLVVYSHLRWDFVFQRPQHVVSRLGRTRRVLFVEEAQRERSETWLEEIAPNVTRCIPAAAHHEEPFDACLASELGAALTKLDMTSHVAWLYTPMAIPLARRLAPVAVVYDCMDELSAFAGAPPALGEREDQLFTHADVVFTGGPSLYRSKSRRHDNVHCFPSSVDTAHFARARSAAEEIPDQRALARPRLGFYGVLDERLDRNLLAAVADARPDWQLVMVGPVVKISPGMLPRRRNIHYFGQRSYEELPRFLAGWDVCLMPFALNEATRFISPTKVLEYMAAERPIVSTAIADVAEPYSHVVRIANGAADFVRACDEALRDSREVAQARVGGMRAVLARTSWDSTVERMAAIVDSLTTNAKGSKQCQASKLSSSAPAQPD